MKIQNDLWFEEAALASSYTSIALNTEQVMALAIQAVCDGTLAGSVKLQVSCDEGQPNAASEAARVSSVTTWTDLASSSQALVAGSPIVWNLNLFGYSHVRLVFTYTSGTGLLKARFASKA